MDLEMERRRALLRVVAASPLLALLTTGCADESRPPPNGGRSSGMMGGMPDWMMSPDGMEPEMMADMQVIHGLLTGHQLIRREVADVEGGICAQTTSTDRWIAGLMRQHVRQMRARIENGRPIRQMDPLFREIFAHHQAIVLRADDLPDGVRVSETSADPQVALLIRQHARRAVSEFVRSGMERAMHPTPLPPGYHG